MKEIKKSVSGNFTSHYLYEREAKLFNGIELEFDGNNGRNGATAGRSALQAIKDAGIEAYIERDGSLMNGYEIVVHPCTYSVLESRAYAFVKAFRILTDAGFTNDNSRAGGHIHITRRALGKSKQEQERVINDIIAFFRKHRQGIIKLSRRSQHTFNQWCNIYDDYRYPTAYDMEDRYPTRRYQAVNLCNRKTIEFRIFKGWTSTTDLLASLQFVNLVVKVSKSRHKDLQGYDTLNDFIEEHARSNKELANYWRSL